MKLKPMWFNKMLMKQFSFLYSEIFSFKLKLSLHKFRLIIIIFYNFEYQNNLLIFFFNKSHINT
jgi:hypothetical protein